MGAPATTNTSSGWNGAWAVTTVQTTPPAYCRLVTVAVIVTSVSWVTGGAVQVTWNRPPEFVRPVDALRVPTIAARSTVAVGTATPVEAATTIRTVVRLPEVTDLANDEIETVRVPSGGAFRFAKDHTLLIPPNMST